MPTNPEPSRRVDVVLHVGTGKAGTTSIQSFLHRNRDRLRDLGYLYPQTPGTARHGRLSLFIRRGAELENSPHWHRQQQSDPETFRRVFRRRFLAEVEGSGLPRILLSDEELFGSSAPALRRLGRFTDRIASSLRLVVYLRRQDDHMVSRYQQGVKIGWIQRLGDWVHEDMSSLYDYNIRLRRLERLLAPTELVVRRFEPDSFVDGSLYQDFLQAAGIGARADEWEQVPTRNLSLDAETVEFLRLLNLHRVENEAATVGLIDNRDLIRRLAQYSDGPVLTLPGHVLEAFMEQWNESNRTVARRWLEDPSEKLFRMPRKTTNTTDEQRLDPTRLDHFLALSSLPEGVHAPIRRLAEREAARAGTP